MIDPRVPVTLLTGFLGAGKTTVLNAVLADNTAGRVAVIVNEFGEAGLDHDLIEESTDEIVLMRSGCLCCSVRGDLSRTIADLLERRAAGDLGFERIVIETTGLADPGPILQTLLVDCTLLQTTRMDGVVTVADAVHGDETLNAQFEAVSQAAMADLIVLSKTDIATPEQVQSIETRLTGLNPGVRIVHGVHGAVRGADLADQIWGLSGLRADAKNQQIMDWTTLGASPAAPFSLTNNPPKPADPLANLSGFAEAKPAAAALPTHDSRIGTASIVLDETIPDAAFDMWLDTLIALRGPDILRVKGIVFLKGHDLPFVFHGVQQIFDMPVQVKDWPSDDQRSRIVVIARDLSRSDLDRSFDILRAAVSGASPNPDPHLNPDQQEVAP